MSRRLKIAFVWMNFTEYHVDRLMAAQQALPDCDILGIEMAAGTLQYDWKRPDCTGVRVLTLASDPYETLPVWRRLWNLLRCVLVERPDVLVCCHYEEVAVFAATLVMRLFGRLTVCMNDSKWEDKPRPLLRESAKLVFLAPYRVAMVGSQRSATYFQAFGFTPSCLYFGYDTVSVARLRRLAQGAEDGLAFAARPIVVVSRLIEKKNLFRLLDAYALYRNRVGGAARPLQILGSGPLAEELQRKVAGDGIEDVHFLGFVTQADLARYLARALCLVLFSTVEQWGLAVNEAVALGIPAVVSDVVGARDFLVRDGINGCVVEPDNVEGLALILERLGADQALWMQWRVGCNAFVEKADVGCFAESLVTMIQEIKRH
ncbi:glycosyltransferase family 4 protein [Magnetospirillum molischianum]|uniref:Glycosyl transferase n=1 Tax=Magnetospirillum molischianum DSM 120 TaxID=1150626 RepID=H8FSN8_MAGML|nr:glycosyltransferase family 4 protein [Magnetospirillum molischianum]CCG41376.1 Glycosyl transferase [Magnetospirillum molischianum DSM 120]